MARDTVWVNKEPVVPVTTTATTTTAGDDGAATEPGSPQGTAYKSSHLRQYCAGAVASFISLVNGASYTWPAVALPQLQSPEQQLLGGGPVSAEHASWLASLLYLVSVAAFPLCAWLYPRCGRKRIGYASVAFMFLQWLLLSATRSLAGLYAARVISGLAAALLFFFTPTYMREIAEDGVRGTVGAFMSVLFNTGILLMNAVGGLLSYEVLHLLYLGLTCAYTVGLWWLPESPPYLVAQGRSDEAERALRWLRGPRADVAGELRALENTVKRRQAEDTTSLRQLCADKASVKGLVLTTVLCANQSLCGFFVVVSYSVNIFTEASPGMSPHVAASIVGALCVLGAVLAARLVERQGRKALYLTSDGVVALCLAVLGAYSYLQATGVDVEAFNWVPVASLSVYMAAVSLAIASLPFVVINEIFLPQAQTIATTAGSVAMQLFGFLGTKFFSSVIYFFGVYTCYWSFGAMCTLISVYLYFEMPETKNRSLESIRKELAGEKEETLTPTSGECRKRKESV